MGKTEKFKEEVSSMFGNEYDLLEEYKGYKIDVLFKHNKCSREFYKTPHNFRRIKVPCPYCADYKKKKENPNKRKKTTEIFKKEVYDLVGNEYSVLGEYKGTREHILMIHNNCSHKYHVTPNKFISAGRRCPICAIKKRSEKLSLSHNEFSERIFNIFNGKIELLSEYKRDHLPILVRHNSEYCGNREFEIKPHELKQGKGCSVCSKKLINSHSFKFDFEKKFGNSFELISNYKNPEASVKLRHKECNGEFEIKPRYLKLEKTLNILCPKCESNSLGEKLIENYLKENSINYETQVSFEDCKYKLDLRFDFRVLMENTSFLIEFDGIQHFKIIDFYGGETDFKKRKERDSIKNQFCRENNIKLLRISYKQIEDIPNILDNYLNRSL